MGKVFVILEQKIVIEIVDIPMNRQRTPKNKNKRRQRDVQSAKNEQRRKNCNSNGGRRGCE